MSHRHFGSHPVQLPCDPRHTCVLEQYGRGRVNKEKDVTPCSNKESKIDSAKDLTFPFRAEGHGAASRRVQVIMFETVRSHTCQELAVSD